MSRKQLSPKPNLTIEIQDFQNRIRAFQEHPLTPTHHPVRVLRLVKTAIDLRKVATDKEIQDHPSERKQRKLSQLQFQKVNLLSSLELLKASAVSALAEKEAEIDRLRGEDPYSIEEQCQFYQRELQRNQSKQSDLQQEREYLMYELRCERQKYIEQISQKEGYIEELHQEIEMLRKELENMHYSHQQTHETLRTLQDENSRLSLQLGESYLAKSEIERTSDLDETIKVGSRRAFSVAGFLPPHSILGSEPDEQRGHHRFHSQIEAYQMANDEDQKYMDSVLEDERRRHRRELCEVQEHYEKQICQLKEIYTRELRLPTDEDQRITQPHKSTFRHNELLLSIKDMEAIDQAIENEVLETSRSNMHDLKYEIKMQNLSECPSIRPRGAHDDTESQFTMRYFQNPFTFRKNRSIESIQVIPSVTECHEGASPLRKERTLLQTHSNSVIHSEVAVRCESEPSEWSRPGVFAAGVLSGVGLASLTYLLGRMQQR